MVVATFALSGVTWRLKMGLKSGKFIRSREWKGWQWWEEGSSAMVQSRSTYLPGDSLVRPSRFDPFFLLLQTTRTAKLIAGVFELSNFAANSPRNVTNQNQRRFTHAHTSRIGGWWTARTFSGSTSVSWGAYEQVSDMTFRVLSRATCRELSVIYLAIVIYRTASFVDMERQVTYRRLLILSLVLAAATVTLGIGESSV